MAELKMLYRLIILYMLEQSSTPLTNTQITLFILEKEYTNYFTIQQSILDLHSSGLITSETTHNNTFYQITEEGSSTLAFFNDKISPEIKADICVFLKSDQNLIQEAASIISDYMRLPDGKYEVTCEIRSGSRSLLKISMNVPDREQAAAICKNWKESHIDVYTSLMELLLK